MRPRKNLLPLTFDSLVALMVPGKPYTAAKLSCIFAGSPTAIAGMLATLTGLGRLQTSLADCGRKRDLREERRIYWRPIESETGIALRRTAPAEVKGTLTGYDLMRFQRLAMESRK